LKFTTPGSVVGIPVNWWGKKEKNKHNFALLSTYQAIYPTSKIMMNGHSVAVTTPVSYSPCPESEYHRTTILPINFHGFLSLWRAMLG
jgi:hypothetical protein